MKFTPSKSDSKNSISPREALFSIDPDIAYREWIEIGMAAKAAGLNCEDFISWSSGSEEYCGEKICRDKWRSFKNGRGITEKTLFKYASPRMRTIKSSPVIGSRSNKEIKQAIEETQPFHKINKIWDLCIAADSSHPYILKKEGSPDNLGVYPENAKKLTIGGINVSGFLVVPCWDKGEMKSLQFISPCSTKKLFLTGYSYKDCYFAIDGDTKKIYIAEGLGHVWTINKITGNFCINTFGSSNLKKVAEKFKKLSPESEFFIVADREMEKKCREIANSIGAKVIELPLEKPRNYDINDYYIEHKNLGDEYFKNFLRQENVSPGTFKFKLLRDEDIQKMPDMEWLVKGIIPKRSIGAVFGESGSGKSFLTVDMGMSIADGSFDWFGYRIKKVPVVYICLEGMAGLKKRLSAWKINSKKSKIPDNFYPVAQNFNIFNPEDISEISSVINHFKANNGIVIIDTLHQSMCGEGEENSSVDMGRIIQGAKTILENTNSTVLFVHHTGKDKTKGMRGHSSLIGALDFSLCIERNGDMRSWSVSKSKDDIDERFHDFKLNIIETGIDEEGDRITSCAIEKSGLSKSEELSKRDKMKKDTTDIQDIVFELFTEISKISQKIGKGNAPEHARCIDRTLFESKTIHVLKEKEIKNPSRATTQSINALIRKSKIGGDNEWLWTMQTFVEKLF